MTTHSSILAWKIPRTEEPDWATYSQSQITTEHAHTHMVNGKYSVIQLLLYCDTYVLK